MVIKMYSQMPRVLQRAPKETQKIMEDQKTWDQDSTLSPSNNFIFNTSPSPTHTHTHTHTHTPAMRLAPNKQKRIETKFKTYGAEWNARAPCNSILQSLYKTL